LNYFIILGFKYKNLNHYELIELKMKKGELKKY